ncbi:hypothetical protein AAVH_28608 [Aphelenchoides avenae]|nr:hypothetical protein AAVH_28608 [Aphelenchus avenae]
MPYGAGGEPLGRQLDRFFQGKKKPSQESTENSTIPVVPTPHLSSQPERNTKTWALIGVALAVVAGFIGFRSRRLWAVTIRDKHSASKM